MSVSILLLMFLLSFLPLFQGDRFRLFTEMVWPVPSFTDGAEELPLASFVAYLRFHVPCDVVYGVEDFGCWAWFLAVFDAHIGNSISSVPQTPQKRGPWTSTYICPFNRSSFCHPVSISVGESSQMGQYKLVITMSLIPPPPRVSRRALLGWACELLSGFLESFVAGLTSHEIWALVYLSFENISLCQPCDK